VASIIVKAADEIRMPKNTMLMIHNPMYFICGGFYSNDLAKYADDLGKMKTALMACYGPRLKVDEAKLSDLMDKETWMSADEAVAMGFADCVTEEKNMAASIDGSNIIINGLIIDTRIFKSFPTSKLAVNYLNQKNQEVKPEPAAIKPEIINHDAREIELMDAQARINNLQF
jgi:ATP-dependent Clp protease protease subunit